jgi:hypothetical protein
LHCESSRARAAARWLKRSRSRSLSPWTPTRTPSIERATPGADTTSNSAPSSLAKASRWTHAGLVDIAPDDYGLVRGVSADGAVIAGTLIDIDTGDPSAPYVWTSTLGKHDLTARLASEGADLRLDAR